MGHELYEISHHWEEPDGLHALMGKIRETNPSADLRRIRYAYYLAEQAHSGQTRGSGEPYITHPLAVADILVELGSDDDTIVAALLHDVLEDCPDVEAETIRDKFGPTVLALVDGVTKLTFSGSEGGRVKDSARAAETLRKMLLAMAADIRVMVIKLADRMHNMSTLDGLPPEKRIRIANETLDIYAPLAARLGIWNIKWQLEDMAFKVLHPKEFGEISELVAKRREERERELNEAMILVKDRLADRGVRNAEVNGRPKHLYSIFNKIVKHNFRFEEILDLLALRVIVEDIAQCYQALGVVHELWMPVQGLFSDYIAKPKPNGYQSLHTKVVGPHGDPMEVQIRTREMHEIAEYGVAAHWSYKEKGEGKANPGEFGRLRQQLFDWSSDNRTSSDFLRSVSTDLFSEQVFAFTPKGDVIDLPAESTPIDFAFRVHSTLGLNVVGAKVNGQIVPLSTKLQNGDVIELLTRKNAEPSLDWLEFVKSANAKSKLRAHFRKRNKTDLAARGRDAIERELRAMGLDPKDFMGEDKLIAIAKAHYNVDSAEDLLAKVGDGLATVQGVVGRLRGTANQPTREDEIKVTQGRAAGVLTLGGDLDRMMIKRARCCEPVPGEDVVGYVSRGRGIQIHRRVCPNALRFQQAEPERLVPMEWPKDGHFHPVTLKIISANRQGLLMDISTIFAESKSNVRSAKVKTLPNSTAEIEVQIDVSDIVHLNEVMTKISNFSDILSLLRLFGKGAVS